MDKMKQAGGMMAILGALAGAVLAAADAAAAPGGAMPWHEDEDSIPCVNMNNNIGMNLQQFQKAASIVITLNGVEIGLVSSVAQAEDGTGVSLRGVSVTWADVGSWLDGKACSGDLQILGKDSSGAVLVRADIDTMRVLRHTVPSATRQNTVVSEVVIATR